ncbi:ATP-binding response regulator [Coraliomargarita parva]|uniref:ATP-binding response regulator n=1 Tax=Coraliomargarita parva TaxID=3014050 RepID=UPI0022B4181F|nr:hybrid sensor histidine kinase/response regulator [Coraliomargarita parva]
MKEFSRQPDNVRILVVDDQPQNLAIVGEILKRDGLKFFFATNGEEAIQAAKEEQPGLILLDVMMPGSDGFTVCRQLKADKTTSGIPIIFLTAKSETVDTVNGLSAGGVDYIRKPVNQEELLARVHTHLDLFIARKNLEKLYHKKTELLRTLAHDIKNPAGAIEGLAQELIYDLNHGEFDVAECLSLLELMASSAKGMLDLVKEILDEERSEHSGSAFLNDGPVDVAEVLGQLVQLNTVMAQKRSIQLRLVRHIDVNLGVSRRVLSEIFDNIINNAVKYSAASSLVEVHLMPSASGPKALRIEVRDQAPVISEDERYRLFQEFSRGSDHGHDGSSSASHGIGLSIVKRLVKLLQGEVGALPRPDAMGNIFYVELPRG